MVVPLCFCLVGATLFTLALYFHYYEISIVVKAKTLPLPPGPKGQLFFGLRNSLPKREPWKVYSSWSKLYKSSILSFRVYNRTTIILNDAKSVSDLLERRSHIYSDRPERYMSHTICGRSKTVFNISSQNPRHKTYRKLVQQGLGPKSTKNYAHILQEELNILLEGLAKSPKKYIQHVRRNSVGVIMRVAYGYSIKDLDDTFVRVAEETTMITDLTMANGSWLVDYYPIVKYLPSFLPGGEFKRKGKLWRERLSYLSDVPHQWVKKQLASGTYSESFTSSLLHSCRSERKSVNEEDEDIIRYCAGGLYVGASDTTVSAVTSFILLMALHPTIQSCAQSEIDEICGGDLPQPSHLGQLRYLQAVLKEVLRYAPVGNIALPHKVNEDDEYNGYRIPKGSTVIGNVWAITHDPEIYPDPNAFDPSRFLPASLASSKDPCNTASADNKSQPDPRQWVFGFGRRACPGTHFAETSMLLNMAGILSHYNISIPSSTDINGVPGCDEDLGRESKSGSEPAVKFTTGITSHIEPFDIDIKPRTTAVHYT